MLDHQATSAWWRVDGIEPPAAKGRDLQSREGTSLPYWHSPCRLQRPEANGRSRVYEPRELPILHAASIWRKGEGSNPVPLGIRPGFQDQLPATPADPSIWLPLGDSNSVPPASE